MAVDPNEIRLPAELLPSDGRFGSGPSKVRPEAVARLAEAAPDYLGTSHRKPGVKSVVAKIRGGISELLRISGFLLRGIPEHNPLGFKAFAGT